MTVKPVQFTLYPDHLFAMQFEMGPVVITFAQLGWKCADVFAHLSQNFVLLFYYTVFIHVIQSSFFPHECNIVYNNDSIQCILSKVLSLCKQTCCS